MQRYAAPAVCTVTAVRKLTQSWNLGHLAAGNSVQGPSWFCSFDSHIVRKGALFACHKLLFIAHSSSKRVQRPQVHLELAHQLDRARRDCSQLKAAYEERMPTACWTS